jgi:membrane protease YdiL (CAAX protease family)
MQADAPRRRREGLVLALAIVGAIGASVLFAGPLTNAIASVFDSKPEFAKVFRYLALGLLVVAAALVLRPWRDVPRDVWGLRSDPPGRTARLIGAGFLVAALALAVIAAIHFAEGAATWDRSPDASGKFWYRLRKYLLPALPFALVEEAFFRGWLVDRLGRRVSALAAAGVASLIFGFLHAFRAQYAPIVEPGPAGALEILRSWGEHLLDVAAFGPRFLGLTLFALVLCAARRRFATIAFGMGFHAAAYSFLPLYSALTEPASVPADPSSMTAAADARTWLGSKWLYDGVPGIALLALLAFLLWPKGRRGEPAGLSSPTPAA